MDGMERSSKGGQAYRTPRRAPARDDDFSQTRIQEYNDDNVVEMIYVNMIDGHI